jgi:hypothetical protein
VMALAPEASKGAVKSLYREAPGLVFYQDPKTLDILGAYDLSKAIAYDSPETIPLAPIRVTTDRDIFPLSDKENKLIKYRDPNYTLEQAMKNFANIKDTVLAGEEPFYRLRVLQAYRDGLIPNIPDSVPPPRLEMGNYNVIDKYLAINNRDSSWFDLEKRSYRDVTIVSDGAGGIRLVQVWGQQDGTVGTFWYHHTEKAVQANGGTPFIEAGYNLFERILRAMFTSSNLKIKPTIDFKSLQSCLEILQDEVFCTGFMNEETRAVRAQAIDDWMATLMVPAAMQNGLIQFPMDVEGQT